MPDDQTQQHPRTSARQEGLEARIAVLETLHRAQNVQLVEIEQGIEELKPLIAVVASTQVALAELAAWSQQQRAEDKAEAEAKAAAAAEVQRAALALAQAKAARIARKAARMRFLRPLAQALAAILLISLTLMGERLSEPIGAFFGQRLGWGWWALGILAVGVALVFIIIGIFSA